MSIAQNLHHFLDKIPEHVSLVAVSKTKPIEDLQEAYDCGQRIFGENKIQEMARKWEALPKDIEWHMIGHVQTNKVKQMIAFVSLIHSVDRLKLLKEINKQAAAHNRKVNVLLQIKIAAEDTKFGMPIDDATALLEGNALQDFPNVHIQGLMGMGTFTNDMDQLKKEFEKLQGMFLRFRESANLTTLSMGMSGDYELAIDCGSTMIRVGSAIFGTRNY
jgi:pyridoxal phosphate enzyme (YggS family)